MKHIYQTAGLKGFYRGKVTLESIRDVKWKMRVDVGDLICDISVANLFNGM